MVNDVFAFGNGGDEVAFLDGAEDGCVLVEVHARPSEVVYFFAWNVVECFKAVHVGEDDEKNDQNGNDDGIEAGEGREAEFLKIEKNLVERKGGEDGE